MNVRSPLTLPALAALALLCVSPLHAVPLEDALLPWWLMGEQASAPGGHPGGHWRRGRLPELPHRTLRTLALRRRTQRGR